MAVTVTVIALLAMIAGLLLLLGNMAYGILLELRSLNENFDAVATRDRWRIAIQKIPPQDWSRTTRG